MGLAEFYTETRIFQLSKESGMQLGTLSTQPSHSQGMGGPRLQHLHQQNCWGTRATMAAQAQGYSLQRLPCLSTATAACGLVHPDPPAVQQFSPTGVVTHNPTCTHCSTLLRCGKTAVYTQCIHKVGQQENAEETVPLTRQLPPQTGRWPSQCPGWTTCRVRSLSETWRGRNVLS